MTGKFSPIEDYTSESGKYELLPFRFENLSNDEVVLTNSVGEFTFLTRETLHSLVNHSLKPSDPFYRHLRARHFLRESGDRVTLDLLALRTRTKLKGLANFTGLHLFVVSLRCDHSCHYCQVSRQSEDKVAFDMTVETANRALEIVFNSPNPTIKIEFQGGEPLLNFNLIKHIVEKAENRNKEEKRSLQFVIATTLSLANDEILEYCRDHGIYLSSSLDGPKELHNKNRPRPDHNSYEKFVEGLKKARDILGYDSVSALMTTSSTSLDRVTDIIDEYICTTNLLSEHF
ncbi:MAG: radical SAM protein, partial [bacterium]